MHLYLLFSFYHKVGCLRYSATGWNYFQGTMLLFDDTIQWNKRMHAFIHNFIQKMHIGVQQSSYNETITLSFLLSLVVPTSLSGFILANKPPLSHSAYCAAKIISCYLIKQSLSLKQRGVWHYLHCLVVWCVVLSVNLLYI